MPVYNGDKFIKEAIDSLLRQKFANFMLIISDNASIDETEKICKKYAENDSRVIYIRQEKNIGAIENFKYVLEKSCSEYFMWAAHDDYWDEQFLAELVNLLDEGNDRVVAFCAVQHVDINKSIIRKYKKLKFLNPGKFFLRFELNSFERFILQNHLHGKVNLIYGLIRREVLIKSQILNKWGNIGWGADLLMVAQLLRYGNVAITTKELWRKTQNPDGEGSIKIKNKNKSFIDNINGALYTLKVYNKYAVSFWKVQKKIDGALNISIVKRILFTVYEIVRFNLIWIIQIFQAIIKKMNLI